MCACVCVIRVRGTQARRHADHVDEERRLAAIQVVHAVACGSTRNTPYRAHPHTPTHTRIHTPAVPLHAIPPAVAEGRVLAYGVHGSLML